MSEKKYPIGGFAPGNYQCNCCKCGTFFHGDKRAVECESCAIEAKEKFDALSPDAQAEVMQGNAHLMKEAFKDWGKKPEVNLAIIGHGEPEQHPAGSNVWVKATTRLPGWDQLVEWRFAGKEPTAKETVRFLSNAANLHQWEWLDESNEQPAEQISQDAHEKEVMMRAFGKIRQIFEGRQWIMEGRGSYPYNDDRYREEIRYMYDEFDALVKDTWANIKSHSSEYRQAIIEEYLKEQQPNPLTQSRADFIREANGRDLDGMKENDAVVFIEWAKSEGWEFNKNGWVKHSDGTPYVLTPAQLYNEYQKQNKR